MSLSDLTQFWNILLVLPSFDFLENCHFAKSFEIINLFKTYFQESSGALSSTALMKKQGVSGQSVAVSRDITITKHNKDFRSRTIIKEAIMENDFLKNLSQGQVHSRDNHHYPRHTFYGTHTRGNTVTPRKFLFNLNVKYND